MTRTPMTQAVAADYADAMLVGRRAKNVLFLFLALILLVQIGLFFVARYVHQISIRTDVATSVGAPAPAAAPTTEPATTSTVNVMERQQPAAGNARLYAPLIEQVIAGTDFLGVVFAVVLPIILLLVVTIMLVGRLVGVSHVTSAFCWSIVFLVILFPWQALLNSQLASRWGSPAMPAVTTTSTVPASEGAASGQVTDLRIPGALYTYPELQRDYDFPNNPLLFAFLKWARFVGFPVVELIILLMIQGRSSRGLRFALGEAEVPVEVVAGSAIP